MDNRTRKAPLFLAWALLAAGCAGDPASLDEGVTTGEEATQGAEEQAQLFPGFPGSRGTGTQAPAEQTPASEPTANDGAAGEGQSCPNGRGAWRTGDTTVRIQHGGLQRTYILHVPASYRGDSPVPLLIDMHPMLFGTAQSQRRSSGYAAIADREGFIVAYPQGVGGALSTAWNLGPCCTKSRSVDDYGFILAIVDKLKKEGCIDNKRVYAAGYSNGGGLAHYLACKHADVFAAVSPAAFDLIEEVPCQPSRPISVISFRGTNDEIVKYPAHESRPPTPWALAPIHFLGAEGAFKKWAELNGCTGQPTSSAGGCRTYAQCEAGVEVTLCTKQGGGHDTGDARIGWERMKKYTLP